VHASLSNVLKAKPVDGGEDRTIAELIASHVAGRVTVIAAGQIRTPEQARSALDLGLSLVAVGQGLVINPDWVELAKNGSEHQIAVEVRTSKVTEIEIPTKLWGVIQAATGWFKVRDDRQEESSRAVA
jgi:2,4-dienoyl-CoA reductase-like NADH-dependent reductase (Old Yellow Enzyme family)